MSEVTKFNYFQKLLNKYASIKQLPIGFYLQEDGDFGNKSKNALKNFQSLEKIPLTGEMDKTTYNTLTKACSLNCWNHNEVNCWVDGNGTKGEKPFKTQQKKFVVLHHTVSGGSPFAVKTYFQDKAFGTQFVLGSNGDFVQCYNDFNSWGWHINVNSTKNVITKTQERFLAENSVAVEICNFGGCDYKDGKFLNAYGSPIAEEKLIDYRTIYGNNFKFRGKVFYEKYPSEQIKTLKLWIEDMLKIHSIDITSDNRTIDIDWFNFDLNACNGKFGLFTHTNVREDKSDLHPQPELIQMLKEIYKK